MTAPVEMRGLSHIIIREIVVGLLDRQTLVIITHILVPDSKAVILGMACHKEQPVRLIPYDMHSRNGR